MKTAALFLALTLLLTWPLALRPASTTLPMGPDGELFIWTLAWDAHAFVHQPFSIFDANIYHPLSRTLAFSENLIGSALIAAPVLWASGNPVLALNIVMLVSCMLCGLGGYLLARRIGISPAGAVVAGVIFAFSPPRFFRIGQLHLGPVQWIPFAFASLHAYLDHGRRRDLWLAAGFFTLQALSSGHGAVFLTLAMAGLVAWRAASGALVAPFRRLSDLGITGVLLLAPAVLVSLPYRAVQQEMGLKRSLENWAVTPGSFLAAPTHVQTFLLSWLPGPRILDTASAYLFPGFLPLLLAAAAIVVRRSGKFAEAGIGPKPGAVAFYGVLALISLWLSIGPPFGLWPLVYWLPGMNFIRVPSRFTMLAVLGLAIVAAAGFDWLAARLSRGRQRLFAASVTLLLVAEFAAVPLAVIPYRVDIPLADRWLATRPGPFAVAEVPLPDPLQAGPFERRQTMYMLHSMAHWQKTVHGYSGIRAPLHDRLYALLRTFPDGASLDELARLDVRYIVVHTDLYPPGEWDAVSARIDELGSRLQLEHVAGPGRIYSMSPSARQ
ncbi:MAG: hypothetical protein R6V57_04430 [Vicinamibacterales bacterium]